MVRLIKVSLCLGLYIFSITSYPSNLDIISSFRDDLNKKNLSNLKKKILALGGAAIPELIKIIKSPEFPDQNRWVSMFLLAQIIGDKSAPYIAKFLEHPNWILKMASLKILLILNQVQYGKQYSEMLTDPSLIIRLQALENIRKLNLAAYAPKVWNMLYDEQNYYLEDGQGKKRSDIIGKIIKTLGDLQFSNAKKPFLKIIQKSKYNDIFYEIDYFLGKIFKRSSPEGSKSQKRKYWKRVSQSYQEI